MKKEHGEIPASELPESLIEQIAWVLHQFSSCLIKLYSDKWDEAEMMLIGSGTFVALGDIHGILTAQHVTNELSPQNALGFTLQEQEHNFHIPVQNLTIIDIAVPKEDRIGPDLSFINIPGIYLGTIKSQRMFYDLSVERDNYLEVNFDKRDPYFVCGGIDERTTQEKPNKGFDKVIGIHGFCGESFVENSFEIGDYDYLEINIDYNLEYDIPRSFSGMSGGGIWLVPLLMKDNGTIMAKENKYCGVIFYQTERRENTRYLRGHGPKSIYNVACEKILNHFT